MITTLLKNEIIRTIQNWEPRATIASLNVAAYPDRVAVGVDINVTHLKGVKDGLVTGIATANHLGKSTGNYTIDIFNEKNEKTATARLSLFFREKTK